MKPAAILGIQHEKSAYCKWVLSNKAITTLLVNLLNQKEKRLGEEPDHLSLNIKLHSRGLNTFETSVTSLT